MPTPDLPDGTLEHDDYRDIAKLIVDLQARITIERRDVERLEALLVGTKAAWVHNEDDIAALTHQLGQLKHTVVQHENALDGFVARLDQRPQ